LAGEHLSLYQLTLERGTRFFTEHARGAFALPGEEQAAEMFEFTQARLAAAGLPAYEVSNHARPGAACRHNLIYWRHHEYVRVCFRPPGTSSLRYAYAAPLPLSGPQPWPA